MKNDCNFAQAKANRAASKKFAALCELSLSEQHRLWKAEVAREAAKTRKEIAAYESY